MAVSRQCKTRGNRTKTGTSQLGVPDSSEAAHHSASSARSRFSPRVGLLTFVASRRRVHQPKTAFRCLVWVSGSGVVVLVG